MPQAVKQHAEERMEKAIQALRRDLATLRAGRATRLFWIVYRSSIMVR